VAAAAAAAAAGGDTVVGFMDWGFFVWFPEMFFSLSLSFFFAAREGREGEEEEGNGLPVLFHFHFNVHHYCRDYARLYYHCSLMGKKSNAIYIFCSFLICIII
jgi:hypothetical protein